MALSKADIHQDGALTGLSLEYKNPMFIGERVFPTVRVVHDSDKYYTYGREKYRQEDSSWEDGALRPRVEYSLSTESYNVGQHAYKEYITDKARRNVDQPLRLDQDTTEFITDQILLDFEIQCAAKLVTGNYPAGLETTLTGVDQWSDLDNSDPIDDIQVAISAVILNCGVRPTSMLMGQSVWDKLIQHPTVLDFIKRDGVRLTSPDDIRTMFNFQEVLVGSAIKNTAAEGATEVMAYVWPNEVLIYVNNPNPGVKTLQHGVTFRVSQAGGGTRVIERWREQEEHSDVISVIDSWDIQYTAQNSSDESIAGYLIINAVA